MSFAMSELRAKNRSMTNAMRLAILSYNTFDKDSLQSPRGTFFRLRQSSKPEALDPGALTSEFCGTLSEVFHRCLQIL